MSDFEVYLTSGGTRLHMEDNCVICESGQQFEINIKNLSRGIVGVIIAIDRKLIHSRLIDLTEKNPYDELKDLKFFNATTGFSMLPKSQSFIASYLSGTININKPLIFNDTVFPRKDFTGSVAVFFYEIDGLKARKILDKFVINYGTYDALVEKQLINLPLVEELELTTA